jgi:hypothetical protein
MAARIDSLNRGVASSVLAHEWGAGRLPKPPIRLTDEIVPLPALSACLAGSAGGIICAQAKRASHHWTGAMSCTKIAEESRPGPL